jgi:DNA-binding CsgD family transcriptional regulator
LLIAPRSLTGYTPASTGRSAHVKSQLTIRERDLRSLLALLDPSRLTAPDEEFPASFMEDLAKLIPCGTASFIISDNVNQYQRVQQVDISEVDPPTDAEEIWQMFWGAYWQEGGCGYPEATGDRETVVRDSDLITQRDKAKTLMGEHDRLFGTRHEVMVSLPPIGHLERRMLLNRKSGRDFSDREVMLLQLLRPHLVAVHARQQVRRSGIPDLTPRQWEIIRLLKAGLSNTQVARNLKVSEATVRKHLENIYRRLDVTSRTAALAKIAPIMDSGGPAYRQDGHLHQVDPVR